MSSWIYVPRLVRCLAFCLNFSISHVKTGHIERIVVAKSHGKQLYYDARKSHWGDLWPHTPRGSVVIKDRADEPSKKSLTKADKNDEDEQ
jgi:ribosomal protein RSM22 (predicted rRNA methylase)